MPSASKLSRCLFSLLRYPLRQSLKNVGVKGIRRLTPDGVREANINNAAGHRLYVTLVPVSHRRFLRASVRVNHPRVAAIRTAEQALVREIARHVATGVNGCLRGRLISPNNVTVDGGGPTHSV